jgi:hemerythrin
MKPEEINLKDKKYLTHIDIIDKQHKTFFEIYNDSIMLLAGIGSNVPDEEKLTILIRLRDYIKTHFQTEEELMALAEYPDFDRHIKEHIHYIDKIDEFTAAYKYRNPVLFDNMLIFLKKWFLSHIRRTDAKYISSLRKYLGKTIELH